MTPFVIGYNRVPDPPARMIPFIIAPFHDARNYREFRVGLSHYPTPQVDLLPMLLQTSSMDMLSRTTYSMTLRGHVLQAKLDERRTSIRNRSYLANVCRAQCRIL